MVARLDVGAIELSFVPDVQHGVSLLADEPLRFVSAHEIHFGPNYRNSLSIWLAVNSSRVVDSKSRPRDPGIANI